jgi:hypothetical protein
MSQFGPTRISKDSTGPDAINATIGIPPFSNCTNTLIELLDDLHVNDSYTFTSGETPQTDGSDMRHNVRRKVVIVRLGFNPSLENSAGRPGGN